MGEMDTTDSTNQVLLEQQQRHQRHLMFHEQVPEQSGTSSSCNTGSTAYVDGMTQMAYWADPALQHFTPTNHMMAGAAYGQSSPSILTNGELAPVTLYFTPQFQPTFHQVGTPQSC